MRQVPSKAASAVNTQQNVFQKQFPWFYALWKFSRPHTIIGTTLSLLGMYFIAVSLETGFNFPLLAIAPLQQLTGVVLALLTCLCGNVYIVGLNQLEDVEIDRVNKPHLPLASGEFSRRQGVWIVCFTGALALLLAAWQGVWLMATVWLSLLIGTLYSLPPIRLKRFPIWASLCIFSVRGAIVNLGLFLHFRWELGNAGWGKENGGWSCFLPAAPCSQSAARNLVLEVAHIPPAVWALTAFILVFTFAIAIFKDIPDLEGDRRYHISTFTLRLGAPAVFNLARWVLTGCYGGMAILGLFLPHVNAPFLITTHLLALVVLWRQSSSVDLGDKKAIAHCYQFIWKLFFLEYLIFPAACLLQ